MTLKLFIIVISLVMSHTSLAQPKSRVAECFTTSHEKIYLKLVSSELDFYQFELDMKQDKTIGKYWDILLRNSFIVDYSYRFGNEIKTEASEGYFLLFKPRKFKVLEVKVHNSQGTKTMVKSFFCRNL